MTPVPQVTWTSTSKAQNAGQHDAATEPTHGDFSLLDGEQSDGSVSVQTLYKRRVTIGVNSGGIDGKTVIRFVSTITDL
jgi:hypothetical protein